MRAASASAPSGVSPSTLAAFEPVAPCPLHTLPLAAVLGLPDMPEDKVAQFDGYRESGWTGLELGADFVELFGEPPRPCGVPGFLIGTYGNWRRGFLVVLEEATGRLAGGIAGGELYVFKAYRGLGLGPEILIRAFEDGVKHPDQDRTHNLTPAARASRVSAHRKAVERALAAGVAVPDEVLTDYPDLAPAAPGPRR